MCVFVIADLHIGHRNILKHRPCFSSIEEHDNTIIDNWNKTVKRDKDIIWVLGDMLLHNNDYNMDSILNRLKGTIRIITGNHCYIKYYPKGMIWNGIWKKYGFWLSHAPVHPNELRGSKNIHGHVHNKTIDDDRYINVCCEVVNYTPVHIDELRKR